MYVKTTEEVVEMKWICTSCQHANLGRHIECQNCKNPKESNESYAAPPTNAPAVVEPKLLMIAALPPNWKCSYCGSDQRDKKILNRCAQCGATQGGETKLAEKLERKEAAAIRRVITQERSHQPGIPTPSFKATRMDLIAAYEMPRFTGSDWQKYILPGGLVLGALAFVAFLIWVFSPHETSATVETISWKRSIEIEERHLKSFSDWGDPPSDAVNVSCSEKVHHDDECNPHKCGTKPEEYVCGTEIDRNDCTTETKSRGNGFATRTTSCKQRDKICTRLVDKICHDQCPVYRTYCEYDAPRWEHLRTASQGGFDHHATWPAYKLEGPDQRVGERIEIYEIVFRSGYDRLKHTTTSENEFRNFTPKDSWLIRVNRAGMVWPQHKIAN